MINSKSYWQERSRKYGHTGWSDYSVYFYDQNLRIKAIRDVLDKLNCHFQFVLDYGCGTGEFSRVLADYSNNVCGVDIADVVIEQANYHNTNPNVKFEFLNDIIFDAKYDLILCVTVLQHVIGDDDFVQLVNKFRNSMIPGGRLVLLESFSNLEKGVDYIKLRRFDVFVKTFESSGFKLKSVSNFYHPGIFPTVQFLKYKTNLIVRFLNKLCLVSFPGARILLRKIALLFSNKDSGVIFEESMSKILVFEV